MGVVKRSVSIEASVAKLIEEAAREDGVSFSAWISAAAENAVRVRAGLKAIEGWWGDDPPTAEERAAVRAEIDKVLFGDG